jgi:hypothetical protein
MNALLAHSLPKNSRIRFIVAVKKTGVVFGAALCLLMLSSVASAQLSGTKNIPGDYATLAAAITDLNAQGVAAGGVTLNLLAGNPETAPAGGYVIGGTGSAVLTTAGAGSQITIQGNANTITASAALTVGNLNDAIFKLIGADWITITGFTMQENAANTVTAAGTNNMTEWGVALLYVTTTDGAQNNTIQNCTIDLDRTYQNTFGIYSNSTHSATAVTTSATATGAAGGNSGLKIYGNSITDVNIGIVVVGPTAAADNNDGLDIGGGALATGNSVSNYGTTGTFSGYANVSGTVNGILVRNTKNFNVSFNTVASSNGGTTSGTLRGIYVPSFSNAPTGTITNTINNNNVSVRSAVATGTMNGILVEPTTASTTSTLNINNNDFNTITHTLAASGTITLLQNAGPALNQNINSNTFTNLTVNTTGSVTFISNTNSLASATGVKNVNNNSVVTAFTKTGAGGTVTFFTDNGSDPSGATNNSNNNTFSNITITGATSVTGISNTNGGSPNKFVQGNTVSNISGGTTGTIIGLSINFDGGTTAVSSNTVSNVTNGGAITGILFGTTGAGTTNASQNTVHTLTGTGTGAVTGLTIGGSSGTRNVSRSKIYNLENNNAAGATSGIIVSSGTTINVFNNLIGDLRTTAVSATNALNGINITSSATSNISFSYNTVNLNATSTGANFGSSALFTTAAVIATAVALDLRNNVLVNTSTAAGTGVTVAYRRSANALTNYVSTSNNNDFYAGTPGATNLIFFDGTNSDQTIGAYRARVSPRDSVSITENPPFLSTAGSSANFLHISSAIATQLESGGAPIGGITNDCDGDVRNGSTPDVGADEFSGIPLDLTPPLISYTLLSRATGGPSRSFTNVTITDPSGVNTTPGTRPRVYYKKSTDANDSAGWKFVEASGGGGSPFSFTIDYSLLNSGSVLVGDFIQYFVVAQDLVSPSNVGINSGVFNSQPASVALTSGAFPIGGTINSYQVQPAISGAKSVCSSGCDYTGLTTPLGLFADINAKIVTGNLAISITSDLLLEDGSNALNQWAEEGVGGYTLTVQSSAAVERVISGAVANGLIRLNGTDRVTFDGRFGGNGQFLRFRNMNTSNPTFTFIDDATNNTIESCIIESGNTSITSGTVLFSTSTGTLGNSSNTIHNCDIRDRSDAAGVPANAVYSSGSGGAPNGSNTVSGCNVFNWTNAGVLVTATGAGNGWTVNPSNFYQTAARTTAMTAISIQGGSGHSILNNSIGGTAPGAAGSFLSTSSTFRGIDLTVGTASPTSVQGNTIKNIRSTYPAADFASSYGIFLEAGLANIGTVSGNTVGSSNVAERFEISGDSYGIRVSSTSTVNLSNNTVNNMTTAPVVPTGEFYFGISVEGAAGAHTVVNNTVTNFTNGSTPDAGFPTQTIGMIVSATGAQTIRGNNISTIGSSDVTTVVNNNNRVWGLILSATGVGTVVDRNTIANIFASSPTTGARADVVTGLQSQTVANGTYTNNMISTSGGGASDRSIFGILDLSASPAISNYYFNSVNITGTATAATNTYAFNRNNTATVTIRDNIFADTRSGGTGFHVAMANTNAAATGWSNTASDYNLLWNSAPANLTQWLGSAGANNFTLAGFQAASGGDGNSTSGDPLFISASDLHIPPASPAVSSGIAFGGVTTDFDLDPRPVSAPDIGADELVQAAGGVIPGGTYYNASAADGDTLGGNVTITNTLYLNGKLTTGTNALTIECNGVIVGGGSTNYVIGNLKKNFCGVGSFTFPVGTLGGGGQLGPEGIAPSQYSPVDVNITAGTFPALFHVKAVQGPQPIVNASTSIQRYWTLAASGITADLTFHYLATDVMGNESLYKVIRVIGPTPVAFTSSTVNTGAHTASVTGITSFSDWTVGQNNSGPTATPATISGRVTTSDGSPLGGATIFLSGNASTRTITNGDGQYRFEKVPTEAFYTVTPALVNYSFSPASRSFSLVGNQTDVGFTANATSPTGNPLNVVDFFVRQQYLDFLGREPDMGGWLYWTSQISACGNNQLCINQRRIDVSAAFFASEEFQQTGSFIYRLYQTGLGRQLLYGEFTADRPRVLAGPDLEENRAAFAIEFVTRPEFTLKYQNAITADAFVNSLLATVLQSSGLDLSAQRDALIAEYSQGSDLNHSRSRVLRTLADHSAITDAAYNPSFVLMEYFGYLRRDIDQGGYEYWLDVLNNGAPNNYRGMVCAFLTSSEYQLRFSPIVTHSNAECGP